MRPLFWKFIVGYFVLCAALVAVPVPPATTASMRGLPFVRAYSYEDIGDVPRGSRLGFDHYGRLAVIHDAVYAVLNDSVWLNIVEPERPDRILMTNVVHAPDGRMYYGGRGTWGYVDFGADGRVHPHPVVPAEVPAWIQTAAFYDITATDDGVYFGSWNGVVFWDFRRARSYFFEVPRLSRVFRVRDRVYVSAFEAPLRMIDLDAGPALVRVAVPGAATGVVELAAPLDESRTLLSYVGGRFAVFDGEKMTPWAPATEAQIKGHVSVLQQTADGRVAIGVTGQGLFLCSADGDVLMLLNGSEFHNVNAVANREPGVLWVATADAIEKVLYGNPVSAFNQQLGLPVNWPIVVSWGGWIVVASDAKVYRGVSATPGEPARFEPEKDLEPPHGAWAMAAAGPHLLIGNGVELYAVALDGTRQILPTVGELTHLVMPDRDHCYAIGRKEIAYFEYRDGKWEEPAPRIPGLRYPSIVHVAGRSAWIEMGGDGVARVWYGDGKLHADVVGNASWTTAGWVNIGTVGEVVVLSALREQPRRFFDERTGAWCERPNLQQLFDRSPFWIARMQADSTGVIWATHNEGLVRFAPRGNDYDMDIQSFDLINDRYPMVQVLEGDEVWMSAERALYHIERSWLPAKRPLAKPMIVSLIDVPRNRELLSSAPPSTLPLRLPYAANSLAFRFFSGTDSWRRTPGFEYRLAENEPWIPIDGSVLSFRSLREGKYRLQVRIAAARSGVTPTTFDFVILPPWTRSWPAYTVLALASVLVFVGAVRWSSFLARKRNRLLERIVHERTSQLETTMRQLKEETQNAATLAERNRLANEIHDSVQQGLTGAILQLDTTLKLSALAGELRNRLNVVRNMISYARQEVQHAVWDMESPLLEGTDLTDALRNLTAYVDSGDAEIEVTIVGDPVPLSRDVNHNLLRIAQEASTNAFRHAQAGHIVIQLEYEPGAVALIVSDDGVGFRAEDVMQTHTGHLGLRGIRARVRRIGGELTIESSPNSGTTIRVVVSLAGVAEETNNAVTTRK